MPAAASVRRAAPIALPLERVLVIHDEIDLPFGEVRTRVGGGLAGHNGLKSLKRELGGRDFARVRVGVGRPDSTDPEIVAAYVLGRFREPAGRGRRAGRAAPPTPPPRSSRRSDDARTAARSPRRERGGTGARARRRRGVLLLGAAPVPDRRAARPRADERPAVVVAPDDRAAGELAADLAAWLAPRRVCFYPSRGVTYESHLAPPPHLVGLRIAALDALAGDGPPRRRRAGAGRLGARRCRRRSPIRRCVRTPSSWRSATCSISTSARRRSSRWATSASRRSRTAASSRCAAGCSTCSRATAERAVRVELFDIEIESLRTFSTFTQRSLESIERIEVAPAAELALEHRGRRWLEGRAPGHRRAACRSIGFARCSSWSGMTPAVIVAASDEIGADPARPLGGRLRRLPRRRGPPPVRRARGDRGGARSARTRIRLHSLAGTAPVEFHAQAAGGRRALARRGGSRRSSATCARAIGPSSPGRAAATASAPPTTSPG